MYSSGMSLHESSKHTEVHQLSVVISCAWLSPPSSYWAPTSWTSGHVLGHLGASSHHCWGSGCCWCCQVLPECKGFGEGCHKAFPPFFVMYCTVVSSIWFKLLLCLMVPEPVQVIVHYLGLLWLDGAVDDSLHNVVVSVDCSVGLGVS